MALLQDASIADRLAMIDPWRRLKRAYQTDAVWPSLIPWQVACKAGSVCHTWRRCVHGRRHYWWVLVEKRRATSGDPRSSPVRGTPSAPSRRARRPRGRHRRSKRSLRTPRARRKRLPERQARTLFARLDGACVLLGGVDPLRHFGAWQSPENRAEGRRQLSDLYRKTMFHATRGRFPETPTTRPHRTRVVNVNSCP